MSVTHTDVVLSRSLISGYCEVGTLTFPLFNVLHESKSPDSWKTTQIRRFLWTDLLSQLDEVKMHHFETIGRTELCRITLDVELNVKLHDVLFENTQEIKLSKKI